MLLAIIINGIGKKNFFLIIIIIIIIKKIQKFGKLRGIG